MEVLVLTAKANSCYTASAAVLPCVVPPTVRSVEFNHCLLDEEVDGS